MSCPVCDAERDKLEPLEAFVFGLGMGESFGMIKTGDIMCEPHRVRCIAIMKAHTHRLKLEAMT